MQSQRPPENNRQNDLNDKCMVILWLLYGHFVFYFLAASRASSFLKKSSNGHSYKITRFSWPSASLIYTEQYILRDVDFAPFNFITVSCLLFCMIHSAMLAYG